MRCQDGFQSFFAFGFATQTEGFGTGDRKGWVHAMTRGGNLGEDRIALT
jgi:hypothetical protein